MSTSPNRNKLQVTDGRNKSPSKRRSEETRRKSTRTAPIIRPKKSAAFEQNLQSRNDVLEEKGLGTAQPKELKSFKLAFPAPLARAIRRVAPGLKEPPRWIAKQIIDAARKGELDTIELPKVDRAGRGASREILADKKSRVQFLPYLPCHVLAKLEESAEKRGVYRTTLARAIVERALEKVDKRQFY